ncbi:hypothetical protein [Comamonas sp. C11]|uniref:hypothetical protein n=1 Tax=Comamonas sp. C11 TaxID=2966554 RepID=UPI0021112E2D|nr:hypothetical protein [Comamonas sp. C11]UUC94147.1 hypothetical protein NOX35_01975 [Comamonas sp. C11]
MTALLMLTLGMSHRDVSEIFNPLSLDELLDKALSEDKKSNLYIDDTLGKEYLRRVILERNVNKIKYELRSTGAAWVKNNDLHILNMSINSRDSIFEELALKNAWSLESCELRNGWVAEISKDLISKKFINIIIMLPSEVDVTPRWNLVDLYGYESGNSDDAFRIMSALAILGVNYRDKKNPEFSSTLSDLIQIADVFEGCCVKGDDERVKYSDPKYSSNQIVFLKRKNYHDLQPKLFHLNFEKSRSSMKMREWVMRDKLGDYDEMVKTLLIPLGLTSGTFIRLKLNPIAGQGSQSMRFFMPKAWLKLFKTGQAENRGKRAETPFKQSKHGDELDDIYFPAPQDLKDLKSLLRR